MKKNVREKPRKKKRERGKLFCYFQCISREYSKAKRAWGKGSLQTSSSEDFLNSSRTHFCPRRTNILCQRSFVRVCTMAHINL